MPDLELLFKTADWKREKHVPVIEAPDKAKKGEWIPVQLTIGLEIPHPNTTEHHIRWIELHFLPKDERYSYQIGRVEFSAHGEAAAGPNLSGVYSHPQTVLNFKADKSGTLYAFSSCNIHGLWQNSKEIAVE